MSELKKKTVTGLVVGLVISVLVAWLKGVFEAGTRAESFSALCDGFFVSAVLLGGIGVLTWVRNSGSFDAMFFGVSKVFKLKWSALGDWREEYGDYQKKKKANRSSPKPLLICGGVYLVLAVAMLICYLNAAG